MAPFRIGLIGAGRMGRTHLRALAGSDVVKVTAIAEMSPAARETVAAPGLTLHESVTDMLDQAALDGVLIVAPTDQHGAIIAEVAARGLPILCEKPCGLTAAAARASAQTAAAAGVPLQVAYWRRFVPGLRQLHDRIAAGELGVIHLVTCYQWDERPPSPVFRAHSGGIAIDMGVHEFDQLRWLTGQDISGLGRGGVRRGAGRDRRRGRRAGGPHAVRRCHRVRLAGPLLPGGRRGVGRGVRHPRARAVRRDRPGRGRGRPARGAAPAGGELRVLRPRRPVPGRHGRRRGRGAGRRRAGHGGDTGHVAGQAPSAPACRPATGTGRADERGADDRGAAACGSASSATG